MASRLGRATAEDAERGPRIVKYIRLESYEDALNNLEVDRETEQRGLPFPDYTIRYMLDWETKRSSTLLNVKHLERPFDYELAVRSDGETRRRKADLPETFHFLIGLRVRTRRVYHRDGQRVLVCRGKTRQGNETVVLWRDIAGWGLSDFEDERAWVREHKLTEGAETVYVNGQSVIPDAFSLDPDFKRLMFAPVTA